MIATVDAEGVSYREAIWFAVGRRHLTAGRSAMYYLILVLLLGLAPVLSILGEFAACDGAVNLIFLVEKWATFWMIGVRLMTAGLSQLLNPEFTARTIFGLEEKGAKKIVQELGLGNMAIGLLGVLSLFRAEWMLPSALTGGAFYGLAGVKHLATSARNPKQTAAMVSDFLIFLIMSAFVLAALV